MSATGTAGVLVRAAALNPISTANLRIEVAALSLILINGFAYKTPFGPGTSAVEAAWAVVDQVLKNHHRVRPYKRRSWGPKEADALIASDGRWHNPKL